MIREAHTKMQKAKVGDLIYLTTGNRYAVVTRVSKHGASLCGSVDGSGSREVVDEDDYQIVFSPHSIETPAAAGPAVSGTMKALDFAGENSEQPEITGHRIYVGLGETYAYVGFVPFGKTATLFGAHLIIQEDSKETERAKAGDIIRNFEGQLMTVERIDGACVYCSVGKHQKYASPHGSYTIVKRASDDQPKTNAHCVTPGLKVDIPAPADTPFLLRHKERKMAIADTPSNQLREELRRRGDDVKKEDMLYCRQHGRAHHSDCEECHSWIDARLEWSGEKIRTSDLVAMLAKREGVAINTLSEDYAIRIVDVTTDSKMVVGIYRGPCTILVIPEAAK